MSRGVFIHKIVCFSHIYLHYIYPFIIISLQYGVTLDHQFMQRLTPNICTELVMRICPGRNTGYSVFVESDGGK
jgi:hypothetical protein